jgi:hypothetical protein
VLWLDAALALMRRSAFALCVFFAVRGVVACQCVDRPSIEQALKRSDVVAIGRVLQVTPATDVVVEGVRLKAASIAVMEVEQSWKGARRRVDLVFGFSDCDYSDFRAGQRYLFFAVSSVPGLGKLASAVWAPRCWPTQPWQTSAPRELGAPAANDAVDQGHAAEAPVRKSDYRLVLLTGGAFLAIAVAAVLLRRRFVPR